MGIVSLVMGLVVFLVPFVFIALTAVKTRAEAARLSFSWPKDWNIVQNFMAVIEARDYMMVLAFFNSLIITVGAVTGLVIVSAMLGFVLQRRAGKTSRLIFVLLLAGLMIPAAVVPTIFVLQVLGLFKTLQGMILIQIAYGVSFSAMLYRSFISTIPRELDEAAIIDGAKPWQIFFRVVMPLLRPVTVTVIVIQSIFIFNDFTTPLYYLPGKDNVTVQLTLYNFQSDFSLQYNLLFMNILLVTIPTLLVFIFFNRQIVAGMTAGAVKG